RRAEALGKNPLVNCPHADATDEGRWSQARSPVQAAPRATAARGPHATADPRRVRRPGAPRRGARTTPPERRARTPELDAALGSARHRQDEPGPSPGPGDRRRVRDDVGRD